VDVGSLIGSWCWGGAKAQLKWKTERPADGRDAANDVDTIDRAAVPGVSRGMRGFNEDSGSAAIISSDGDGFVEKLVEVFAPTTLWLPFSAT
jgi:hypothetical protein